ncbi:bc71de5a-abea-4047-858b-3272c1499fbc [Sclerotinia trifoliorum]|uniref:Bc71de5a-abea-4047-858b-3272c1499fbc n=1 Tax=Sclerotinia trifoliorum TaxID=28548 RepID=A0A8H2ZN25_9HELO|nr:bc71de5a-abea-4047-858b-3272c1499fbc [Sclerotinia trifoliorum]
MHLHHKTVHSSVDGLVIDVISMEVLNIRRTVVKNKHKVRPSRSGSNVGKDRGDFGGVTITFIPGAIRCYSTKSNSQNVQIIRDIKKPWNQLQRMSTIFFEVSTSTFDLCSPGDYFHST